MASRYHCEGGCHHPAATASWGRMRHQHRRGAPRARYKPEGAGPNPHQPRSECRQTHQGRRRRAARPRDTHRHGRFGQLGPGRPRQRARAKRGEQALVLQQIHHHVWRWAGAVPDQAAGRAARRHYYRHVAVVTRPPRLCILHHAAHVRHIRVFHASASGATDVRVPCGCPCLGCGRCPREPHALDTSLHDALWHRLGRNRGGHGKGSA